MGAIRYPPTAGLGPTGLVADPPGRQAVPNNRWRQPSVFFNVREIPKAGQILVKPTFSANPHARYTLLVGEGTGAGGNITISPLPTKRLIVGASSSLLFTTSHMMYQAYAVCRQFDVAQDTTAKFVRAREVCVRASCVVSITYIALLR